MGKYLSYRERLVIEDLLKVKTPVKQIASILGRSLSTIYKEIKKGQTIVIDHQIYDRSVYAAAVAQSKHEYAQTSKGRPIKLGNDYLYAQFLRDKIVSEKFSPYSALVAARSVGFNTSICVGTLYSYIYKGYLLDVSKKHLIYKSAPKSKEPPVKRILHPQFPSIDHRPQHINTRQELGHWEMDCVCGEQGTLSALLVFTERVTRYELIFKIPNKTTSSVVNVLDGLERRYPDFNERFRSITCDNGSEFMDYPGMVRSVYGGKRTEIYYCHPYCSSERGSNENCNRIIRRWIPKGQDIGQYSEGYIHKVQDWINYYPRRLHGHFSAAAWADVWLSA